jgi:hypothetical protein
MQRKWKFIEIGSVVSALILTEEQVALSKLKCSFQICFVNLNEKLILTVI